MENIMSETEDVVWLAHKLKDSLDEKVLINSFGIYSPILEGKYAKDNNYCRRFSSDEIRFYIKYNKEHFLRIQIEDTSYNSKEEKLNALYSLTKAIGMIKKEDGTLIGLPLALYSASSGENDKILTVDWAFSNVDEWITSLKENTMFDDGASIENLQLIENPRNNQDKPMKVFVGCSSSDDIPTEYFDECTTFLAKLMKDKDLVFGAYDAGLMGLSHAITTAMGGEVIGIAPEVYANDLEALNLPKENQIVTKTISERTTKLIEASDALVFLPGGIGTISELFMALESKRNNEFDKPIVIYNANGYFDDLLSFMEKMFGENFTNKKDANNYLVSDSIAEIKYYLDNYPLINDGQKRLDTSFKKFSEAFIEKASQKKLTSDN